MSRLTKSERERKEKEQKEACDKLRELLSVGSDINIIQVGISRSGSTSHYRILTNDDRNNKIRDISYLVALAIGAKRADNGAIKSSGWGLSRSYNIVYSLARSLYPDGHPCTGEDYCPSNDHRNGDRDYTKGKLHKDGGYAFRENKI